MDRNDFASRVMEQTDRMYRIAYVLLHNNEDCRDAMQEAADINTWTVNDEKDIINTINRGANRIITNYSDRAVALLKKMVD